MSVPTADLYSLSPSAVVELFVLDATVLGGGVTRFHGGTNGLKTSVVWQGNTYQPFPVMASGFEMTTKGTLPRPTVRVSNASGLIGGMVRDYADLVGATVTRKRTLVKYLDAVNFGGSNPTADPTAAFADDVFYVERKVTETRELVEFELASASDMQGLYFPRRIIQATVCPWTYKGVECGYSGPLATCNKTLLDCTAHFSGSTGSISLSSSSVGNVITRSSGSFLTDGFGVGMAVIIQGFTTASNNGNAWITAVTATTMTVDKTLVTEGAAAGRSITMDPQLPFGGFPGAGLVR